MIKDIVTESHCRGLRNHRKRKGILINLGGIAHFHLYSQSQVSNRITIPIIHANLNNISALLTGNRCRTD